MPTTITPSQHIRKSARTIHKPIRMDDDVVTPNPMGVVIPLTHDLMTPKQSIRTVKSRKKRVVSVKCSAPLPCADDVSTKDEESTSSSSEESKRYRRSGNYSKTHLFDNWMLCKDISRDLEQQNSDIHTSLSKMKK